MNMNSLIQVEAVNKGLNAPSLALLIHIKDNFFLEEIKGIDLQNNYPILFLNSAEVRKAVTMVMDKGFLSCQYSSGIMRSIEINKEAFKELFTNTAPVIKRAIKKKTVSTDSTPVEILDIVKHYNTFAELPKPASLTATNKSLIASKLDLMSKEVLIDAITYADEVKWIKSKLDEPWLNMAWIVRNIEGFIEGGKYRVGQRAKEPVVYTSAGADDIITF